MNKKIVFPLTIGLVIFGIVLYSVLKSLVLGPGFLLSKTALDTKYNPP